MGKAGGRRRRQEDSGSLLERGLLCCEGPFEPGHQRLDIGFLDRRAGPDAQARRRIAIVPDVEGDAFLLERRDDALGEGRLAVGIERGDGRIGEGEADGSVGARRLRLRQEAEPRLLRNESPRSR